MAESNISRTMTSLLLRTEATESCASFVRDESAAAASTFAIAMFALVGIAGVAWDWTRMTALDSELQNAADQAALAAATQLDGGENAISRSTAAASGLVANITVMANDGEGLDVTVPEEGGLVFYEGYNQITDEFEDETSEDADARVVTVTVAPREAFFALTPVVGFFRSGDISAQATASLGSAICNTPPVMICNPMEGVEDFSMADYVGHGLRLISDDAGAPGNFGFLANGTGSGAAELARALGYDSVPGNCVAATGVTTEPGIKDVVFDALNTRFDIDTNGENTCPDGSTNCSAAPISRKDLVKDIARTNQCGIGNGGNWKQPPAAGRYIPPSARLLTEAERNAVTVMGYPRDLCHAWSLAGDCSTDSSGVIGTGDWDRDAFFKANYNWTNAQWLSNTGLDATATRFQVYEWETSRYLNGDLLTGENRKSVGGGDSSSASPVCRAQGDPSRRKITAAVVDCDAEGVNGRTTDVAVRQWVELFLVEPSTTRRRAGSNSEKITDGNDVYVEVIRVVDIGGDGANGDVVRRDVPYLIR